MKKILILNSFPPASARSRLLASAKDYLNERRQNDVQIIQLKNPRSGDFRSTIINGLAKKQYQIVATTFRTDSALFSFLKRRSQILAGIDLISKRFDFTIPITGFTQQNVVDFARRLSVIDKLNWDTNFFKIPIARLNHSRANAAVLNFALEQCKKNKIRCLYFTAETAHSKTNALCKKNDFFNTGDRITFQLSTSRIRAVPLPAGFSFRKSRRSDIAALVKINKDLYTKSRYYQDPKFSRGLCNKYYMEWARKLASAEVPNSQVFVLCQGSTPTAYIGLTEIEGTQHIILMGVKKGFQKQGLGKILLGNALARLITQGYRRFQVVTQGNNHASQKICRTFGFQVAKKEIDYHKWF